MAQRDQPRWLHLNGVKADGTVTTADAKAWIRPSQSVWFDASLVLDIVNPKIKAGKLISLWSFRWLETWDLLGMQLPECFLPSRKSWNNRRNLPDPRKYLVDEGADSSQLKNVPQIRTIALLGALVDVCLQSRGGVRTRANDLLVCVTSTLADTSPFRTEASSWVLLRVWDFSNKRSLRVYQHFGLGTFPHHDENMVWVATSAIINASRHHFLQARQDILWLTPMPPTPIQD